MVKCFAQVLCMLCPPYMLCLPHSLQTVTPALIEQSCSMSFSNDSSLWGQQAVQPEHLNDKAYSRVAPWVVWGGSI